ncbi:MAG: sensor histidine kinase [Oculatellaceae cyanobacterium bins.114]|nr:sensor histidine kinase [Oculatellaceae cyanobacterium bins.114]
MSTSSEFLVLCRSQVAILTQGLGASLSVVYLTQDLSETMSTKLVPIVAYPEIALNWEADQVLSLLSGRNDWTSTNLRLLTSETNLDTAAIKPSLLPALPASDESTSDTPDAARIQVSQHVMLPLIHEGVVMGLLVTARSDRSWNDRERAQIERIATTLSLACVLDQRSQWLDHDIQQQRLLQAQQHDILDDLLHQFRNPLTALRTFGKLLLRRLRSNDPNRDAAAGIVRESDRLQELLRQFDVAIDLGEADLLPFLQSEPSPTLDPPSSLERQFSARATASDGAKSVPLLPSSHFLTGAELQLTPHLISEALKPLLDSARAIAQDRYLNLQINIPANLTPIAVDIRALREVLSNLIDNALKYTPVAGTVYLWISEEIKDGEMCQIFAIADTGPGIPTQDQHHLFERHYRGVQASTDIPGTGLGLAIARDLIHQMQGHIQIFSPASTSPIPNPFPMTTTVDAPGTVVVVWFSTLRQ